MLLVLQEGVRRVNHHDIRKLAPAAIGLQVNQLLSQLTSELEHVQAPLLTDQQNKSRISVCHWHSEVAAGGVAQNNWGKLRQSCQQLCLYSAGRPFAAHAVQGAYLDS
jgi:hypothetical protein